MSSETYPSYYRKHLQSEAESELLLDVNQLCRDKLRENADGQSTSTIQCNIINFGVSPDDIYISYGVEYTGSNKYALIIQKINNNASSIDNARSIDNAGSTETTTRLPPIETIDTTSIGNITNCVYMWENANTIFYLKQNTEDALKTLYKFDINELTHLLIFEELNPLYKIDSFVIQQHFILIQCGSRSVNYYVIIDLTNPALTPIPFINPIPYKTYSVIIYNDFWYILNNFNNTDIFEVAKVSRHIPPESEGELSKRTSLYNIEDLTSLFNKDGIYIMEPSPTIKSMILFNNYLILHVKINGNINLIIIDLDKNPNEKCIYIINDNPVHMTFPEYNVADYSNSMIENINAYYVDSTKVQGITDTNIYIIYTSLTSPKVIYKYDLSNPVWIDPEHPTRRGEIIYEDEYTNYNKYLYTERRIFAPQPGTKNGIPISLLYRTDLYNGSNALLLRAYGAYGSDNPPTFIKNFTPLLDRGVIYATTHVRGGGFFGKQWYMDGKLLNKKHSIDDYIASAEYLIKQNICHPKKIIAEGHSAGGVIIGASINLRPDLFQIAVLGMPFVDVLNTMSDPTIQLTIEEWGEYGNPNEHQFFEYINGYCPYQNIGSHAYPHIFSNSSLTDLNVPYWEIYKLISKIRAKKTNKESVQIIVNEKRPHVHGINSNKLSIIQMYALKYAFIFKYIEDPLPVPPP